MILVDGAPFRGPVEVRAYVDLTTAKLTGIADHGNAMEMIRVESNTHGVEVAGFVWIERRLLADIVVPFLAWCQP